MKLFRVTTQSFPNNKADPLQHPFDFSENPSESEAPGKHLNLRINFRMMTELNVKISSLHFCYEKDEEELSVSPPVAEFASDAFGSCKINEDDLLKEMEQLVLDKKDRSSQPQEETADWEKELQEELQEYDVLADGENRDDGWDQEIEEMLKEGS